MRVSIVVPTYNSQAYVAESLASIVSQKGFSRETVEIIVVDGKSRDNTLAEVAKFGDDIARVISEPDEGIYDAVGKGLAVSTGDILTWLSSNDMLQAGALSLVGEIFDKNPGVNFLTGLYSVIIDGQGAITNIAKRSGVSRESFLDGCHTEGVTNYSSGYIQQEGTFWRRSLWEAAGGYLSKEFGPAGDFDLWARFFEHSEIVCVDSALAFFRLHENQTSQDQAESYRQHSIAVLERLHAKYSYALKPTPAGGFRHYRQLIARRDGIFPADYVVIDLDSEAGTLKRLIFSGRIC